MSFFKKSVLYFISIGFCGICFLPESPKTEEQIFLEEDLPSLFFQNIKVRYQVHKKIRGSGCFQEILPGTYIIYNFYIQPEDRNQGYGQDLLKYMCDQAQKRGASRIFVQPGPFELDRVLLNQDKEELLEKLLVFYEKESFQRASGFLKSVAGAFYSLIKINEDAHYLLVRVFD